MYPPLEWEPKADWKGRSVAEVRTSEARKIGEALAPREGSALRKVWIPYSHSSERWWDESRRKAIGEPRGCGFFLVIWSLSHVSYYKSNIL